MLGVPKLGSVCHMDPKLPFFNFLILKLALDLEDIRAQG
jgi:hypothetical protein